MLSQEFMDMFNASQQAKQQYTGSKQAYKGFDTSLLAQIGQRFDAERKKIMGADTGTSFDSNAIAPARVGDFIVAKTADGRYQVFNTKDPSFGTGSTVGDMYDANGKFLGTQNFDTKKGALSKAISAAVPLLAAGMIGGGIAGGFGVGPFADGGALSVGVGAGAGGSGAFLGEGALSGIPAWDGLATGALGGAGAAGAAGTAAMGAGAAGGGGGVLSTLGGLLGGGGGSSWLGPLATLAGGLMGSQGQEASTSSTRAMDPRMEALFYGGLAPGAMGLLESQMGPASKAGNQMLQFGSGLLGQKAPNTATNPYATGILDDMQRRHSDVIGQSLAGIRGNAVGVGGLGGSRQGVAEAQAISQGADNFAGQGFNFMGGLYEGDQNRLRQDWTLGAGMMNQGLNMPFAPLQNTANLFSPFTGFGTTTQTQQQGGGAMGAVGGALGAAQLGKNMGWW
jgi:hypothetical protein